MYASILRFRKSNARGTPVGEGHHNARHPDAVVDQARAMRAAGATHRAIAAALGVPHPTVTAWLIGTRRRPHERIVVQRLR